MKKAIAILCVMLAGCSGMPDKKVDGVDNLKTTEYVLSQFDATMTCARLMNVPAAMAFIVLPFACANINLDRWTCDIYYAEATAGLSLEHERKHCLGYWHDDGLQEYFDAWNKSRATAK